MRELVLFVLRAEARLVDMVDDLAQVVAALNLIANLAEDFADLVFDGVWAAGLQLESVQVSKEFGVDEITQIGAGLCGVVIELAILPLGPGPGFPAIRLFEDVGMALALKRGLRCLVLFEGVEIFEKQQPRGLFGVVEFGGASGLLIA